MQVLETPNYIWFDLYWAMTGLLQWLSHKESACSAGHAGHSGSVPGLGRSPEKGMATHSSILAWRMLWTEEPAGYSSGGHEESEATEGTQHTRTSHYRPFSASFPSYSILDLGKLYIFSLSASQKFHIWISTGGSDTDKHPSQVVSSTMVS